MATIFSRGLKVFLNHSIQSLKVLKAKMEVGRGEVIRGGVERELGENGMSSSKM